ncbi:MAG TPA: translation initiation factor IF-2 [Nitrospirota bacterium]|nr:translation initiation factor IF-2 [Nitrospirota bacterium]
MAKLRVYDLARELGVENKAVLAVLEKEGMAVKSHSSNLEDEQVKRVKERLGKPAKEKPKERREEVRISMKPAGAPRVVKPAREEGEEAPVAPPTAKKVEKGEKAAKTAVPERFGKFKPRVAATPAAPEAAKAAPVPAAPELKAPEAMEAVPAPPKPAEAEAEAPAAAPAAEAQGPVSEAPKPEAVMPAEERPAEPRAAEPVKEAPKPEKEKPTIIKPIPKEFKAEPKVEAPAVTKELTPEEAAEALKAKKPLPKGPKPPRPELEAMEGVERVPFIPSKLKNRLQEVKKPKAAPTPEAPHVRKEGGQKWHDFKSVGKKKGNRHRFVEKVEEPQAAVVRKKAFKITEGVTIKDFAEKIGVKSGDIIKKLFEMGIMATINQPVDTDAAVLIADSFGMKLEVTPITDEEAFVEEHVDRAEDLRPRPPVVTIMGHVDHGKTSLLDAIRETKVTEGEAGGITQHIGAYKVTLKEKNIVFLDTPGHEAFTAMRARGAQVTDIVILVVAADDGVRPQTIEAINHAKAAKVPIIVAVNKIDKPEADQDKVKRELSDQGLVPEEWGGEVIFVPVSAKKRVGIESLLEMILLQAEVMELKANPDKPGRGTIVEAKLDKGRGPIATVLVSTGTIRPGDAVVTGQHYGRIRMLLNDRGKKEKEAGPAMPVEVIGLSGVPAAGDSFVVMEDEKKARQVAQSRMQKLREAELAQRKRVTLDDLFSQIQQGAVKELNIIIKADVQGSVEAVAESLTKLSTEAVKLNVIHGSVGAITESDIMLASASNAIIIGFNIRPEPKASALAEGEGVDVRLYNIIYNAIDEVRAAMEGLLEPTLKEKVLGRAEVRQTFSVPKIGVIAGCYVLDGTVTRGSAGARVLRDNVVVYEGKVGSLKRFKEDVREVQSGYECGIGIENFNDLKVGDVIEVYDIEKLAAKL